MLLIGELFNSNREIIAKAIEARDEQYIRKIAREQMEAGAKYLDVNCSAYANEVEVLKWLIPIIQKETKLPISYDVVDYEILEEVLPLNIYGRPMINSVFASKKKLEQALPLVKKYNAKLIVLCMDEDGMSDDYEVRGQVGVKTVEKLLKEGISINDIYLDPLVIPIAFDPDGAKNVVLATEYIKEHCPEVHCICGLSNISTGSKERKAINRAFAVQVISGGMDTLILDVTDEVLLEQIECARKLLGFDICCD